MADSISLIRKHVVSKIKKMETGQSDSAVRAELAKLRRGVGKKPGDDPTLWGVVFEGLPEQLLGRTSEPSNAEWAIYTALTLYALHQQGKSPKTDSMHSGGVTLGKAMRRLVAPMKDESRVKRRFDALATSGSLEELANHASGLIKLLGGNGIPLDYADFAEDLYWYQFSHLRGRVRLKWGRDFYRMEVIEKIDIEE